MQAFPSKKNMYTGIENNVLARRLDIGHWQHYRIERIHNEHMCCWDDNGEQWINQSGKTEMSVAAELLPR